MQHATTVGGTAMPVPQYTYVVLTNPIALLACHLLRHLQLCTCMDGTMNVATYVLTTYDWPDVRVAGW